MSEYGTARNGSGSIGPSNPELGDIPANGQDNIHESLGLPVHRNELRALRAYPANGMHIAVCNVAMRERTPRSGFGFSLTMLVFVAATVLMLSIIMEKFPRP